MTRGVRGPVAVVGARAAAGVVATAVTLAALAGCGSDQPTPVATASERTPTATGAASSPAASVPPASVTGSASGTMNQAPAAGATADASGAAPQVTPSAGGVRAAVVQQIRAAEQGGFDRVTVEFQGTFGAWQARYVPAVTEDPTGDPVPLEGEAFIQLVIQNATFDNLFQAEGGVPHVAYSGPRMISPGLPTVRQVAGAGDFEAVLSLGIGVSKQAGMRAYRLENPSRLVIDIAH